MAGVVARRPPSGARVGERLLEACCWARPLALGLTRHRVIGAFTTHVFLACNARSPHQLATDTPRTPLPAPITPPDRTKWL